MIFLLPHTIDTVAENTPNGEAIRYYQQSLTYAELARRTNSLAQTLIEQGVRRGDRVGIYMNKCLESAIAIYGIMKAGAIYVPINPSHPAEQVRYILHDCGIRHLVTQTAKHNMLQQISATGTELNCLIGMRPEVELPIRKVSWEHVYQMPGNAPPDVGTIEADLAYIIYTSGSTGTPKGIMHTHHSGLSFARYAAKTYGLHSGDCLSNHSPLHFDMSIFDFFAGAIAGATTVLIPEEYTKLPASYSQLLADERITVLFTVPFALIQLLLRGALPTRDLRALRWIIFGGEPFSTKHLRDLMKQLPHVRFNNMYGPAEVNGVTHYNVPPLPDDFDEPIPIGRLFPNVESLVIDDKDCPVAIGETGELIIRSPTMMQGYWGRPDLNAQAFYRRPVFADYEEVFYRTGDLVQLQPDGELKFLGRKDRQIKIRGYRVELDGIEATLSAHDFVEESAVFPVSDGEGNNRIEAAVTLKADTSATPSELVNYLKDLLPWYAIPTKVVITDNLPRTSSGKIDRHRLQQNTER
jgi:amino acid adenylation domain-containing protein